MGMNNDLSIWKLILEASFVVQLVMALLLAASIASWAMIFSKRRTLRAARADADQFESAFWSGGDLGALYRALEGRKSGTSGMEGIFEFGFREFSRLRQQPGIDAAQL